MDNNVLSLEFQQLASRLEELGAEPYRARQACHAIYREGVGDWRQARVLPEKLRARLWREVPIELPEIEQKFVSRDGTVRYLLRLRDGKTVESVFLPDETFSSERKTVRRRYTFCISTQVGCPVNCQFCLTALLGLERNLTAGEIVGQVLTLLREHGLRPGTAAGDRVNLVYMGMGEPFLNYANVMRSVHIVTDARGLGLSPARITISTAGIVDKIKKFAEEAVRPRLAISLNATTDDLRTRLMPLNAGQGGLERLLEAAREYPLRGRERLTFEYVLLAGVTDGVEDARRLAELVHGIRCKVNLIAWNGSRELPFASPSDEAVAAFQRTLAAADVPAYVRRPRGRDIFAACGQLKKATEFVPLTPVVGESAVVHA